MLDKRLIMTAHPMIYPSMRRPMIDAFLDRGAHWMRIDHIPWNENPQVLWDLDAIKNGKIKYGKRRVYEWRNKGKIYHRDAFNNVWQKEDGKIKWIGIYCPVSDSFNIKASEPK